MIRTDENVAYGLSIGLHQVNEWYVKFITMFKCVCACMHAQALSSHDEVQYEQVNLADTGFTMSTNTAYSTINHWHDSI